jgi:Predicted Fe-S-cluster oxidoreductase
MSSQFTCKQCGGCCGPVPATKTEFEAIKQVVNSMSQEERKRLKDQDRGELTCILLDTENKRCSVYNARPLICRQYGQIRELQCPNNKGLRLKSGRKETMKYTRFNIAGILSFDIGWKELEQ